MHLPRAAHCPLASYLSTSHLTRILIAASSFSLQEATTRTWSSQSAWRGGFLVEARWLLERHHSNFCKTLQKHRAWRFQDLYRGGLLLRTPVPRMPRIVAQVPYYCSKQPRRDLCEDQYYWKEADGGRWWVSCIQASLVFDSPSPIWRATCFFHCKREHCEHFTSWNCSCQSTTHIVPIL